MVPLVLMPMLRPLLLPLLRLGGRRGVGARLVRRRRAHGRARLPLALAGLVRDGRRDVDLLRRAVGERLGGLGPAEEPGEAAHEGFQGTHSIRVEVS